MKTIEDLATLGNEEAMRQDNYLAMGHAFAEAVKDAVEEPLLERIQELESKLIVATLPTPPTTDGKTPGQVLLSILNPDAEFRCASEDNKAKLQAAASAVLAAFGQASLEAGIKRMEAVPWPQSGSAPAFTCAQWSYAKERLIDAAREGQPSSQPTGQHGPAGMPPLRGPGLILEPVSQPTTFEAHGHTWTKHTPGDPMPCDGGALVFITSDNPDVLRCATQARDWHWGTATQAKITGWRYADKTKPEPVKANYELQEHLENVKQDAPWQPAVGDVVRLRSGGPAMTVQDPEENGEFWCSWFYEGNLFSQDFPATCLTPAKEEQP